MKPLKFGIVILVMRDSLRIFQLKRRLENITNPKSIFLIPIRIRELLIRLYQAVSEIIPLSQKKNLVQKLAGKKSGKILDIGCGTGEFLGTMKNAGWDTLGLEPSEDAQKQGKENFGLEIHDNLSSF